MSETNPGIRKVVADHLYLDRGPSEASARCDANSQFGKVDLCSEMIRHLQLQAGDVLIDVGCGTGQHLVRFTEIVGESGSARGFDFSEKAVAEARKRGVRADQADGAKLPVEDGACNKLSSSFAIYYLRDATETLIEWKRVLKTGGRLAVSGPASDTNAELYDFHRALTGKGPQDTDLMALGFVNDCKPILEKLGFRDVAVDTFTNPISFPTAEEFVTYWQNTSLFARSVDDADRDKVIAEGRKKAAAQSGPWVVTKRVEVATAVRG